MSTRSISSGCWSRGDYDRQERVNSLITDVRTFGSGDRYIDLLMRKAADLVTVRNGYLGTDGHSF